MKIPVKSFLAAVTFYTIIPISRAWSLDFKRIARWSPLIGILLGALLGFVDFLLSYLGMPLFTRSALIITLWLLFTGGLHLDGVMDTADGLAVTDKQKRLDVMRDSVTGAFGVMAAIILLTLKLTALIDLSSDRFFFLSLSAGWGRFGQVLSIAFYPYLRMEGKGIFHQKHIVLPYDIILGTICLLIVNLCFLFILAVNSWLLLLVNLLGIAIAFLTSWWFAHQLGGHTGDTYGAVVEWTETILLCCFTLITQLWGNE